MWDGKDLVFLSTSSSSSVFAHSPLFACLYVHLVQLSGLPLWCAGFLSNRCVLGVEDFQIRVTAQLLVVGYGKVSGRYVFDSEFPPFYVWETSRPSLGQRF